MGQKTTGQCQIEIRQARIKDAPLISELIFELVHYFGSGPEREVADWFRNSVAASAIAAHINDPAYHCLVALSGQSLAGVITLRDAMHVHHLFVRAGLHRRGVAARLWARAKADALKAGNRQGFQVRSSEYAVPVYERFGFRVSGARSERDGVVYVPMRLDI